MLSRTLLGDTARLIWLAKVRDDRDELEARALRVVPWIRKAGRAQAPP